MASQGGKGKRKRAHKISKGARRSSRPVRLSEVQKALLGGGVLARFAPIGSINHPKKAVSE